MQKFADAQTVEMTPSQREAAEKISDSIAMLAGAGSGKTMTLINRCLTIVGNNWSNLERMLVITFTEKAAAELRQRLRKKMSFEDVPRLASAWIGTFHWFAARILRQNAPIVELDTDFRICDENSSKIRNRKIVTQTLTRALDDSDPNAIWLVDELEFNHARALLEEFLNFRWQAKNILDKKNRAASSILPIYTKCIESLEKETRLIQTLDFQQLEIKLYELLLGSKDILKDIRRRFRHILVDEFQDTSDIQVEIVNLLSEQKSTILSIVGDPRQSIYRFRGANRRSFERGTSQIEQKNGNVTLLEENFRSAPEIIFYVNDLFETLDETNKHFSIKMKSGSTGKSSIPPLAAFKIDLPEDASLLQRREAEGNAISQYIISLIKSGRKFSDMVCLFKAMTQSSSYESSLKKFGIPYRTYGGYGFLERQEICDIISALKYANNSSDFVAMIGVLKSPFVGISDEEIFSHSGKDGQELRNNLKKHSADKTLSFLENGAKLLRPSEIITELIEMTDYLSVLELINPSLAMTANIERFIDLTRNEEESTLISLDDFVSSIQELKKRGSRLSEPPVIGLSDDVVKLMTVHAAKGLEFPVVILPDLFHQRRNSISSWCISPEHGISIKQRDPESPWGERIEDEDFLKIKGLEEEEITAEEKRLLYVAMTRAKEQLAVALHPNLKKRGKETWHDWILPTIDRFEIIETERKDFLPSRNVIDESSDNQHPASCLMFPSSSFSPHSFTVSHFETFERCRYQYYLKFILNAPSERNDAVTKGLILHAALANPDKSDLEKLIQQEALKYRALIGSDKKRHLTDIIKNWLSSERGRTIDNGEHEINFDWMYKNYLITGTIDWLQTNAGGTEIFDFKTGDAVSGEYDLQLSLYASAIEEARGIDVNKTTLIFLESKNEISKEFNREKKMATIKKVDFIIEEIQKAQFDKTKDLQKCHRCYYFKNGICDSTAKISLRNPSQPSPAVPCN